MFNENLQANIKMSKPRPAWAQGLGFWNLRPGPGPLQALVWVRPSLGLNRPGSAGSGPEAQLSPSLFVNFVQVFHLLFRQPMYGLFLNSTGRCSQASYNPSKPAFVRPERRLCDPSCASTHPKIHKGWTPHLLHRPICIANMHLSWPDILPLQLQHAISPSPPLLFKHHWKPSSVL